MDKCQACHPEFIKGLSKAYNLLRETNSDIVILMYN